MDNQRLTALTGLWAYAHVSDVRRSLEFYAQLGLEAVIPINERTGKNVGFRAQIHFFLDDLFPKSIGKPLLGD